MKKLTPYGKFIRKLRIDLNISQAEHATAFDVTPTFLSNMEKGTKPVSLQIINKTIEKFKLTGEQERELIYAVSQAAPLNIKIKPQNNEEALLLLQLGQALLNKNFNREKLKNFLLEN